MLPNLSFGKQAAVKSTSDLVDSVEGKILINSTEEFETFHVHHRILPIISGLLCPFSVLLEIPGLTEKWLVETDGFTVFDTQDNSTLLSVGLAISMTLGVVANGALISRYLEKRVYFCTLFAILCLTLHHVINITALITFWLDHRDDEYFTRGESYWMTMTSTIVSSICNATLIADFFLTKNFARHGSGLSEKQRSLVIAVMGLLCYISLGSLVFSLLLSLSYIDSLYFTISTITSCGLGDVVPFTLASKLFSFPYDIIGLIALALTISIARETIIENFEHSYRYRRKVLAEKGKVRKLAKAKQNGITASIHNNNRQHHIFEEESYARFKEDIAIEQRKEFHSKLFISITLFLMFWFIGAAVFHLTEEWSYFDSLYFCFIFFTTIGYGDYAPISRAGRAFWIFWAILAIAVMTLLLSVATESFSTSYQNSITNSKIQRTIHNLSDAFASNSKNDGARKLLAQEGYKHESKVELHLLPNKVVEAAKGFRDHALYFLHGRNGDTPRKLRHLIDATDEFDEEVEKLKKVGNESRSHAGIRHFLFMIAYERSFDELLQASQHLDQTFKSQREEIEELRLRVQELEEKQIESNQLNKPKHIFSLTRRHSHHGGSTSSSNLGIS